MKEKKRRKQGEDEDVGDIAGGSERGKQEIERDGRGRKENEGNEETEYSENGGNE